MTAAPDLSRLPSVDRLLAMPALGPWLACHGRALVTQAVRATLAQSREAARKGAPLPDLETLLEKIGAGVTAQTRPGVRPVFNLGGTVLHTNLGRSTLPEAAIAALIAAARSPCALEYDLDTGGRGDRDDRVTALLCELTGAEAATVVNNNAAAVFLLLNTLAQRKEVVISRGELVEIGDAFRIPDIMKRAGAKLVEVGTTNRTHPRDYAEAIRPRTALLMKVHASNYSIQGFTQAVPETELSALAREHHLPFVVDLGSGTLVNLERWNLPHEPTPRETIAAGADLVCFSGDKLLGGPQAGLLVGRRELIAQLKRNPLKRALRVGKLTLAALEAVLQLYRDPDRLADRLATLRLLTRPQADIQATGARLHAALATALADRPVTLELIPLKSQIGSGALPVDRLPSAGFALRPHAKKGKGLQALAAAFRALPRPVIGRIEADTLLFDLRCLLPEDEAAFCANLKDLAC